MSLRFIARFLGVFLFGAICVGAAPSADSDQEAMRAFQAEALELKRKILEAGDDTEQIAALQKRMQALLAETVEKLSDRTRPLLEVSMKIVNPLLEDSIAYTEATQRVSEAGGFDYATVTSVSIIDERLKLLAEIEDMNRNLIKRSANLVTDMEAVFKTSKLGAAEKNAFMDGFHKNSGRRIGAMRAVFALDARVYDEVRGIYGQLREQMGKWSAQDGAITFEDDAQVALYNARIERINVLAERQQVAQRRSLGVE